MYTYTHKSRLTDLGWHLSKTYMIFNFPIGKRKSDDIWAR